MCLRKSTFNLYIYKCGSFQNQIKQFYTNLELNNGSIVCHLGEIHLRESAKEVSGFLDAENI